MKKLYILLLTVFVSGAVLAQNKTWVGPATGGSWMTPTNWSGNTIPGASDVVEFGVGIAGDITNVPAVTIAGLIVADGANITLSKPSAGGANLVTIANTNAGFEFVITEGSRLALGNEINLRLANGTAGNLTRASIAGEFNVGAQTYNTDGSNVVTSVQTTGVIGVSGSGGVISNSASKLQFLGDATYTHNRNGGSIPTANWNSFSTVIVAGVTNSVPGGFGQQFGNMIWENANQSGNQYFGAAGTSINGAFVINSTGSGRLLLSRSLNTSYFIMNGGYLEVASGFFFDAVSATLTVNGNMVMTGGTVNLNSGFLQSGTLNLKGGFSFTGGLLTESAGQFFGTSRVLFSGSDVQAFEKSGSAAISNYVDFEVNSGSTLDLGAFVIDGSEGGFTLAGGAKIITAHDGGLRSDNNGGAVRVGGSKSYSSTADYEFRGASTGNFQTNSGRVRDLIINNVNGEVTAPRTFVVDRMLVLSNGYLTPTSGNITVGTAGNASTTNGAFVNGILRKNTNNQNEFVFPVGKVDGGLRTIAIKPTSNNSSTFSAEFRRATPADAPLAAGITGVSKCEYWDLSRPSGSAPVIVTLSWSAASGCANTPYVTDPTTLRVAHLQGGQWRNMGRLSSTGDNTAGTITALTATTTFSPFALASGTESENPLPVVFANVRAYEKNSGVQIEWSNLTEKDVANYSVERSSNGTDFKAISTQLPSSNQDDRADYTAFDASPVSGTNYYRVKAEETTGKIVYSKVLSVSLGQTAQSLKLYPNPVKGHQVNISLTNLNRGQYDVRVVNMKGQDVHKQRINSQGSMITETIDLPATIAPGVYNMVITGADFRETKMFVVQ